MKTTAALLMVISLASSTAARAGETGAWASAAPYRYDRELTRDDDAQAARAMKISGAVLTAVGCALAIVAVSVGVVDSLERWNLFGPDKPLGPQSFGAIGAGAGSAALLGAGIPLLAIGSRRLRAIQRDLRLGFAPAPPSSGRGAAGGSLSLTVRF
ncbi:MAG TPA: hypothetical protein VFF06_13755 [Polyangia bacterium]|nr:hypothetical protein [Polyangia bacterium]